MGAPAISMKMTGVAETDRRLKALGHKMETKIARQALTAAGKPIIKAARNRLSSSKDTGALSKSLGQRRKNFRNGNTILIIGPRRGEKYWKVDGKGKVHKPTKYAHFLEKGTARSAAKPFLRPAIKTKSQAAIQAFKKKATQLLAKDTAKLKSGRGS